MLSREYPGQVCSTARSLEVIGERWTLRILRDAVLGIERFEDFQHVVVVISQSAIVFPGQNDPAEQPRAFDTWVSSERTEPWRVEAFRQCLQGAN